MVSDFSDIPELGSVLSRILLGERHGHRVFRVECDFGRVIVKECGSVEEAQKHLLLGELGVSVPEVIFHRESTIVMQDLNIYPWRLADSDDLSNCEVAVALAEWYRVLHSRGSDYCSGARQTVKLYSEMDYLCPENLERIAVKFHLENNRKWKKILHLLPDLLMWVSRQPQTITYNDFFYTNFAVRSDLSQVIVFDYHLLGYGMVAGDIRNVCSSLSEEAQLAFKLAYGLVSEVQLAVDKPLGALNSLAQALNRDRLPKWAQEIVVYITNGTLLEEMTKATLLIS